MSDTYPERRAECLAHEEKIDEINKELHKHGGWFKVLGSGVALFLTVILFFGARLDAKLTVIQESLNQAAVANAGYAERLSRCEKDVDEINKRHQFKDQQLIKGPIK
jgi:hypothetical protein